MPAPVPDGGQRRFIAGSRTHFRYNLALHAALALSAPLWIPWVLLSGKRRRNFLDRAGLRRPRIPAPSGKRRLWIHAVSVGETLAAAPLVREIRRHRPDQEILVSTVTITGQEVARKSLGSVTDGIFYFPFDLPGICARFLDRVRPDLLAILETEIWPNLLAECALRRIPVVLLNGRVSERSVRGYSRFRSFIAGVLSCLETIAVQTDEDADRIRSLGADPVRVRVTGNMKFDVTAPDGAGPEWFDRFRDPRSPGGLWFVAGSTHEGEEKAVLEAFGRARDVNRAVRLLLAPRHPERFDAVEGLCRNAGWKVSRRTRMRTGEDPGSPVVLLDTMGELTAAYSAADIAFVGGTLVPRGGHNILEPALFGVPTIVGPHMENFREIAELFRRAEAVISVRDPDGLSMELSRWAADPAPYRATGDRAKRLLDEFRGATRRNAEIVESALSRSGETVR
ncbi:MAG: lipid IV(A) 3-deoxy-D-manno-octulosonic acid transferase [Deltaproteobacteria bacterium]